MWAPSPERERVSGGKKNGRKENGRIPLEGGIGERTEEAQHVEGAKDTEGEHVEGHF